MKAQLEFNLSDESDKAEYKCAVKASAMANALWTFAQDTLRKIRKYEDLGEEQSKLIHRIEDEFYSTLEEYGVDLDDLA